MPTSIGLAACLALAQLERRGIDAVPILAQSGLSQASLVSRSRIKVKSEIDTFWSVFRAPLVKNGSGFPSRLVSTSDKLACFTMWLRHPSDLAMH